MRRHLLLLGALVALFSCTGNKDNNGTLDYETLDVNFSVKTSGIELTEGTTFGVAAFCARDGKTDVAMSGQTVASWSTVQSGQSSLLKAVSESDKVVAYSSDHDFRFYAVYPAVGATDIKSLSAAVPSVQEYSKGVIGYLPLTAAKKVVSVLPTVEFDVTTPFSVLNMNMPADIVEEGVPATLKSLTITPYDESAFGGAIAGSGTLDAETGTFTLSGEKSKTVRLDFPEGGLELKSATTTVSVVVLPFTVPEGGFDVEFEDVNGKTMQTSFYNQKSDIGKVVAAGETAEITVSRSADGVVPVTFPVVFKLGKYDGVQNFTKDTQPKWVSDGYWSCPDQPQAWCQWNKVSDPSDKCKQRLETVNSKNISSPGIKGIWTGDNFEFTLPVKKFAAGTKIRVKFPIYGRQQPVFWYIKYQDGGDEWKICDPQEITANDPAYSMTCTFAMKRGGIDVDKVITFENAVPSGYLKIRIECADGSVQAAADTKFEKRGTPWISNNAYGAPFYLDNGGLDGVYFSIE